MYVFRRICVPDVAGRDPDGLGVFAAPAAGDFLAELPVLAGVSSHGRAASPSLPAWAAPSLPLVSRPCCCLPVICLIFAHVIHKEVFDIFTYTATEC